MLCPSRKEECNTDHETRLLRITARVSVECRWTNRCASCRSGHDASKGHSTKSLCNLSRYYAMRRDTDLGAVVRVGGLAGVRAVKTRNG